MLKQSRVRELFDYKNGQLMWRVSTTNSIKVGDVVRDKDTYGYLRVGIDCRRYPVHRVIFLWHHGYLPKFLDHIDGNRLNNQIGNLRPCTKNENAYNSVLACTNSSGVKGVSWDNMLGKWRGRMGVDGQTIFVGYFDNLGEAELAVRAARIKLHGEFANHGEIYASFA